MRYEWYPFPDTYPPDNEKYLLTCRNKKGVANINMGWFDGREWHGMGTFAQVTAWCPLPEPYKGGQG